jgi:hypothetical protein
MEFVTDITPLQTTAPVSLEFPTNKNANMVAALTYGKEALYQCHLGRTWNYRTNIIEKYAPFCVKRKI